MNIINKRTSELKEYEKNPRKNDEAVKYVANSIKEFGFKVPIVIDRNNVIISGHTRLKAAKTLDMKEVPCIVADDLTEEQIKAFRLADNKVGELATWDAELLEDELSEIFDIDMSDFAFTELDDIDWADVDEIDESNYEEPQKELLECPHCHHIDTKTHFMKVDKEAEE